MDEKRRKQTSTIIWSGQFKFYYQTGRTHPSNVWSALLNTMQSLAMTFMWPHFTRNETSHSSKNNGGSIWAEKGKLLVQVVQVLLQKKTTNPFINVTVIWSLYIFIPAHWSRHLFQRIKSNFKNTWISVKWCTLKKFSFPDMLTCCSVVVPPLEWAQCSFILLDPADICQLFLLSCCFLSDEMCRSWRPDCRLL